MENLFQKIVDNAIDFLNKSIDELQSRPKYSIINFATSIELFLKARLVAEHWSLIVVTAKDQAPDKTKINSGDFRSVNLADSFTRLDKTLGLPLTKEERESFTKVHNHRNKAIHFFHEAHVDSEEAKELIQNIVKEQLKAWYYLHILISTKWRKEFLNETLRIEKLNIRLKENREYLSIIFSQISSEISQEKISGIIYSNCPTCGYESLRHEMQDLDIFYEGICKVCSFQDTLFRTKCTSDECNNTLLFSGDEAFVECDNCEEQYDSDFIIELIEDGPYRSGEIPERAYCDECSPSDMTVVYTENENYRCANCFSKFSEIHMCDWCSSYTTSFYEFSGLNGCSQCEGNYKLRYD